MRDKRKFKANAFYVCSYGPANLGMWVWRRMAKKGRFHWESVGFIIVVFGQPKERACLYALARYVYDAKIQVLGPGMQGLVGGPIALMLNLYQLSQVSPGLPLLQGMTGFCQKASPGLSNASHLKSSLPPS